MLSLPVAVEAVVIVPVLMFVGGMVTLVVGLVLLTGGGRRPTGASRPAAPVRVAAWGSEGPATVPSTPTPLETRTPPPAAPPTPEPSPVVEVEPEPTTGPEVDETAADAAPAPADLPVPEEPPAPAEPEAPSADDLAPPTTHEPAPRAEPELEREPEPEPEPEPRAAPAPEPTPRLVVLPPAASRNGSPRAACTPAVYTEADGERVALRPADGDPCCAWVIRLHELDTAEDVDGLEEALVWSGASTQVTANGAATPLQHDVVTRRASSTLGDAFAALSLDRSPGPVVRTAGWRDHTPADLAATGDLDTRAAQLWAMHVDQLRDRGARPAPAGTPRVAPLVHRRRVEAIVTLQRGDCDRPTAPVTVRGSCSARLSASVAPAAGHLETPLLGSWVAVGRDVVAADRLLAPTAGVSGWHPVEDTDGHGVAAACDHGARSTEARWGRDVVVDTAADQVAVVLGSAIRLDVDADEHVRSRVAAELRAATHAHVTIEIEDLGDITLGRHDEHGVRSLTPGSTPEAAIRLDGRTFRLRPPAPDTDSGAWTVQARDLGAAAWSDDLREVSR